MDTERARLLDAVELAWGIIANASGGDWTLEAVEWQTAAMRWRQNYLDLVDVAMKERQ